MAKFADLSPAAKRKYLAEHPNSKFANQKGSKAKVRNTQKGIRTMLKGRRLHDRPTDTTIKTKAVNSRGSAGRASKPTGIAKGTSTSRSGGGRVPTRPKSTGGIIRADLPRRGPLN